MGVEGGVVHLDRRQGVDAGLGLLQALLDDLALLLGLGVGRGDGEEQDLLLELLVVRPQLLLVLDLLLDVGDDLLAVQTHGHHQIVLQLALQILGAPKRAFHTHTFHQQTISFHF